MGKRSSFQREINGHLLTAKDAARFWRKVAIASAEDCWLWTAGTDKDGYGKFQLGASTTTRAHRVAAALAHQRFEENAHYLHSCDVPACCNPSHLKPGTQRDNIAECIARGRRRGIPRSEYPTIQMMLANGITYAAIARHFGVSTSAIGMMVWRKSLGQTIKF